MSSAKQVKAIFGTGRSGTTWLGEIVNTHPDVVYRFEPFHRLQAVEAIKRASETIDTDSFADSEVAAIYDCLLPAHPLTDKPPFNPKSYRSNFAKKQLWTLSRLIPQAIHAYRALYSPRGTPPLVFKEVALESLMKRLLERTSIPIAYIVRHPCGMVNSVTRGQQQGVMPTGRHTVLDSLMSKHDPAMADRYTPQLDALNLYEKNALLWRIDVEQSLAAARNSSQALVVIYEELCTDCLSTSMRVFEHLDLEFMSTTREFIENLYSMKPKPKKGSWSPFRKQYFDVFKNPSDIKDRWKQQLPEEERGKILAIVSDSFAFEYCASQGHWDD
ncbi:MAG: sulfotransferase domain-containing protein [Planctomycetota bacterium]